MSAADELVEWVDEDGTVLDIVTRSKMRAEVLRHRSVFVIVASPRADRSDPSAQDATSPSIMAHKRADWKDYCPGAWDLAFGGVCDPGETWAAAAVRELAEEAGVVVDEADLEDLGAVSLEKPDLVRLLGRVFLVRYDGSFSPDDGEVTELRWLRASEVDQFVQRESVPEDSATLLVPLIRRLGW